MKLFLSTGAARHQVAGVAVVKLAFEGRTAPERRKRLPLDINHLVDVVGF